ncbi:hypothetical protein J437_LFUL015550 [Ladona fulva]|uniref:Uncharacterized protein n=1 Tax=Ladona fulva TaxID=123851 RepID=A0A8K0P8B6_LADFU|nr:hypothetical protein J437_LFUL015550 [Ladona fulva]
MDRLLKGEKASHIGKRLNLNEATVRTIKKNEKEIRSAVAAASSTSAKPWKTFSIKHCIDIISLSLKELKTSKLNACWKKISPSSVEKENLRESSEN